MNACSKGRQVIYRGKLISVIRYASEREKGEILMPGDVDEKAGDLVSEVLESKHPIGRDVEISSLLIFESCPELINIEVTEDNVEKVAKRLSGSAGPSGIDSVAMSHVLNNKKQTLSGKCFPGWSKSKDKLKLS